MQIAISFSTLRLPFLFGQDLGGFIIWLKLIQKDFSNEIRIGCYCLNHRNPKCSYAGQKLKPSIFPLAAQLKRMVAAYSK